MGDMVNIENYYKRASMTLLELLGDINTQQTTVEEQKLLQMVNHFYAQKINGVVVESPEYRIKTRIHVRKAKKNG